MKTKTPPPAPVTIMRPVDGVLQVAEVIAAPERRPVGDRYEEDVVHCNYRLIAIQETGEEMFVGYASSKWQAGGRKVRWLADHPEHRDVIIERIAR